MQESTLTDGRAAEQKQILVLFGSPHKAGATAQLLDAFLEPLAADTQIQIINAYARRIAPCIACDACTVAQCCALSDFDDIDVLIRRADVIVIATPVYNLSFPAPLKAIFDRTQRYYSARFSLGIKRTIEKHKTAALLVTSGSEDLDGANFILRQTKLAFSVMNTSIEGMAVWAGTDTDAGSKTFTRAIKSAQTLSLAIKSKL